MMMMTMMITATVCDFLGDCELSRYIIISSLMLFHVFCCKENGKNWPCFVSDLVWIIVWEAAELQEEEGIKGNNSKVIMKVIIIQ